MENMSNFLEETFAAFDVPSQFLQEADKPEKWIRLEENPLSKFVAFDSQNFAHLFKPQSKNQLLSNHSSRSFSSSHSSKETETEKIKQEFGVDRKITNYAELRTYFLDGDANWNFSSDFEQKRLESNIVSSMENKNGETLINGDNNNSTLDFSEQAKHTKTGAFKLGSLCQEDPLLDLKNEHQNSRSIKERQINAIHQEEGVLVTHIEEKLNTFYIQRLSDKTKIEALSEEIQGFIPSAKFFEENPSPGTLCLGQYSRDGCWYRALILYKKTGKVVAKFIDYGNTDGILFKSYIISPEELQLKAIPPFAYPCRLWGIEPVSKSFSKEAVVLFHHLVTFQQRMDLFVYSSQQVVNAKDQRRPLIYVDICCISDIPSVSDDLSLSIRECFLFLEFGRSTISEDENHTVKKIGAEFFERSYHNPHILLNSAPIQVKITRLDSPSSFYVQCCSSKASLKITIGEMKQHYTSETVAKQIGWKILSPKIGMLCAVKCSSDNLWYRACINDVRCGSKVLVTNVDTGEQEVVYYEGLCKIPDKFLQIPAQAIHCKLANIIPVNDDKVWEPSTIEKFRDILEENESIMATFSKKCDDMYEANLLVYHFDRQTSIACELIDSDLALPSQESFASNYLNESPVENFCKIDEFDTFSTRSMKKLNPLKKSSQIIFDSNNAIQSKVTQVESSSTKSLCHALDIIDVISPSLIFARFSDDQKLYEDYQDALYNKMISLTRKKKVVAKFRPQTGKYCVAYFDKSPFFARVLLLEKCDSYYKAFLVDVGGVKNISEEELLPLPKEMKNKKRKLCQVLSMAGICPPCGLKVWPTSTVDFLKRALNSHGQIYMLKRKLLNLSIASSMDTLATVIDDESNSSTINSSKMNENDNDLNSEVNDSVSEIENELNTELQMSSQDSSSSFCGIPSEEGPFNNTCLPPQPPLEKNFKAVVTYLELNGIVCLHPLESNERLSMMQKAHNLKFKDSQLTDKDLSWDIGYYVVAKFHLDKMWYRAKVLDSKNDNGEVQVEFIDYGNVELVSVEDIRTDFPFMNIPVQCYKCSLGLAPFGGVWTERLLLFFHEICVMKNHEVTVLEESDVSPPLVKLVQEGDTSISNVGDLFVNKLKVCFYTNSSVPDMVHEYESSSDIIIESDDEVFTIEELPYPTDPSELVVVKVVSVVDPSLCFISPQKDVINPTCVGSFWKEAVKAIKAMEELQSFLRVNYNEYKLNEMPLIGGIYLNRFAKEGNSFLRVKAFNVENDEAWVKFIDFGNERKISTKSLYLIPKKYRNVPALAIEVRLKEILEEEEERDDFNVQDVENCLMHTDQKMFASF
ncbi:RING finger protein 17, partial [Armadillidium vulgare]